MKKLLAMFLALVMCLSLLPAAAFADNPDTDEISATGEVSELLLDDIS